MIIVAVNVLMDILEIAVRTKLNVLPY